MTSSIGMDGWMGDSWVISSSIDNTISRDYKIGHCAISENFDVYSMINCTLLIFKNCDHYIKEYITLFSRWFVP